MTTQQALPPPEWEPSMHLILMAGILVMILVSILTAYMEAMHYLRLQSSLQQASTTTGKAHSSSATSAASSVNGAGGGSSSSNGNNNNNNYKYYERGLDSCGNKDRGGGESGAGGGGPTNGAPAAAAISASISNQQCPLPTAFNSALPNGKNRNNNNHNSGGANNKQIGSQKRRKNSSTNNNSEKMPAKQLSSGGNSTINDKKSSSSSSTISSSSSSSSSSSTTSSAAPITASSSPYVPILQNLTNVIASPPPPLPTFDNEFDDSIEYKKLRSKRSGKKLNSLNGSIASGSSDDIGVPSCSFVSQAQNVASNSNTINNSANNSNHQVNNINKGKSNGKVVANGATSNGFKIVGGGVASINSNCINGNGSMSVSGASDHTSRNNHHQNSTDLQVSQHHTLDQSILPQQNNNHQRKGNLKDALTMTSTSHGDNPPPHPIDNIKLYNGAKVDGDQQEQPTTVLPIQPPSSLTSTPSSSSFTASTSSSSSSTSSSPHLSASSYGEYSLLGPGATFELPCLRVRSAQI